VSDTVELSVEQLAMRSIVCGSRDRPKGGKQDE
jgi:hypothetical protein